MSDGLVGTRIRERRQIAGMRQADLAQRIGISGSYLNLIEHNRRRIAGKLLARIAHELAVDAATLSEGAEATLLAGLREAAADVPDIAVELEQVNEFASRFPGWAEAFVQMSSRIDVLERRLSEADDRLRHDPELAASVHEVLSTVASIRSTAAILAETEELQPAWIDRFHANINEDSARLADSSRNLVGYLEPAAQDVADVAGTDVAREIRDFVSRHEYRFPTLERGEASLDELLDRSRMSSVARQRVIPLLRLYMEDCVRVPEADLCEAVAALGASDPLALAKRLSCAPARLVRRLASLPDLRAGAMICLPEADLLVVKPLPGYSAARFASTFSHLPLLRALASPNQILRENLIPATPSDPDRICFAIADRLEVRGYGVAPETVSVMLITGP